jgi:hypothetical protein
MNGTPTAQTSAIHQRVTLPPELQSIPPEVIALLSQQEASRCQAVPYSSSGNSVVCAAAKNDIDTFDQVTFVLNAKGVTEVELIEYPQEVITAALEHYYGVRSYPDLSEALAPAAQST